MIALIGSKGLLGSEIKKLFIKNSINFIEGDLPELNITRYNSLKKFLNPDIKYVINCAAFTNVPLAEINKKEAYGVNARGAGLLARACLEYNIHLIHFSTDFVFDGNSKIPYREKDPTNPLNYYGLSKLHGEQTVARKLGKNNKYTIFRLQWLYGHNLNNFFSKIRSAADKGGNILLVDNAIGSPCSVSFVAKVVYACIFKKDMSKLKGKIFHLTHDDHCSRYTCGKYFLERLGYTNNIIPVKSSSSDTLKRPLFGAMHNTELRKFFKGTLSTWKKDLDKYLKELKNVG